MAVIHPGVFSVVKRFPEQRAVIMRRFKDSESFQALCEDYKQCSDALQYWSQVDSDKSLLQKAEYKELLQSLEFEILHYVQGGRIKPEEG